MRTSPALWFYLFFLLVNGPFGAVANVCSRSLSAPNGTGGLFTGGVQLLIPSWTFSCEGVINDWFAHVVGNTSVTVGSGIEFQVLKPDPVKSNVYNLIYGNTYGNGGESATDSRIELQVLGTIPQTLLTVRPGYIVGVYIDSNAVNKLSLIFEDTAEDIDIYYWENLTGRMCNLSLCDAKVMRGVRPLIGWIFSNITSESDLSRQENIVQLARDTHFQYCNETEVSSCVLPSIEPTISSTLIPSPSSLLASSSSVTPSATTPSSSPTDGSGSGNGGGIFEDLSIQVVAVLGVIVILLLLVIILSLIICICCLCRSKTGIEVSGSVENPGYDGKYELRALPVV